jgi:hypothetical protein
MLMAGVVEGGKATVAECAQGTDARQKELITTRLIVSIGPGILARIACVLD